ncbi:hypothetical protein [Granulicella sp. dw_53]|uniref:hypothetical protein n=1 Tax=Granulicella sp. dw_53 TaxID=2719792 RepID=UPI001BD27F85|nr:hypothetical protein [Granulicella sp. dw_53]
MSTHFSFEQLVSLLGRSENDPLVRNFFGHEISNIHRDEYYGSLEFKPEGVDVVFKEAPWVVPSEKITDPKILCVAAFHLHREGHEGFSGYSGQLPDGVALGDSETELLRKMGEPIRKGGGGTSSVLKRSIPRWFWFPVSEAILHVQLDSTGRIDMATLQTPGIKLG